MEQEHPEDLNKYAEELSAFFAMITATQQVVRFKMEFQNPVKGMDIQRVEAESLKTHANQMFEEKYGGIPLSINPELIIPGFLKEITPQINQDRVTVSNGCCRNSQCPTTRYHEILLQALVKFE